MEEIDREDWGTILKEKWKFLWAIFAFLILDLGLVALWACVLYGFHHLIHLIDPTNSFILLVILKWLIEITTSGVVVYSTIEDVKRATKRIRHGARKNSGTERKLLDTEQKEKLSDEGKQQQTTDRIPTERIP